MNQHPPPPPMCEICQVWTAIFQVTETVEHMTTRRDICGACMRTRSLLWERFKIRVAITPVKGS